MIEEEEVNVLILSDRGVTKEYAPIPSLLAVSAYASQGRLDIRIVVLLGAVGAFLGANLGYGIGYVGGRPLVERMGHVLHLNPGHLARSEMFFARHGAVTILCGRFVLGLRSWASVMAGMSRMPIWTFELYSAAGGLAWAIVMGTLGFYLGSNWFLLDRLVHFLGLGGLALVVVVIVAALVLRRRAAHR